jgi:hypothetical protein
MPWQAPQAAALAFPAAASPAKDIEELMHRATIANSEKNFLMVFLLD